MALTGDMGVTLLRTMRDPNLFGGWFKDEATWRAWRVFLRALFGLPIILTADRAVYERHTGRTKVPTTQAREAWLVVGRRGGKSFIVALVAVFLACFRDYQRYLAPGERATIMVLAADRKQARVVMRFIRAFLQDVPMLARMTERSGVESIDLTNRVTLEVHTATYRSVRGYTIAAAILDEVAFWRSDESANPDSEIVAALLPAMTTVPGSLLLGISSPYARRGVLWQRYEEHYGQESDVLIWQSDSRTMNPTIPESLIEQAYSDDPSAAASEYGGQFRSDIEGFLQPEWISRALADGVHELAPTSSTSYFAFTDPSGGSNDSFTLAIAHNEQGRLILDVCRGRRPPFNPQAVVVEYAELLKRYGLFRVTGDRYAGEWPREAFRQNGIHYDVSERTASQIYLESLPKFAQGAVQLLDNRQLANELRQLERRTGRGQDIVDHPPRGHDDLAVAACGALLGAVSRGTLEMNAETAWVLDRREQHEMVNERLLEMGWDEAGDTDVFDPGPFDQKEPL